MSDTPLPDAGWFEDPLNPSELRWWNGTEWTAQTQGKPSTPPNRAKRTVGLVVAMLLAGLVVAFAGYQYFVSLEEDLVAGMVLVPVYLAVETLPEGIEGSRVLDSGLVEEGEVPSRYLPVNVITSAEQLIVVLTGRVAAGPISEGSMLTADQWVQEGESEPNPLLIPPDE